MKAGEGVATLRFLRGKPDCRRSIGGDTASWCLELFSLPSEAYGTVHVLCARTELCMPGCSKGLMPVISK